MRERDNFLYHYYLQHNAPFLPANAMVKEYSCNISKCYPPQRNNISSNIRLKQGQE